jgi:hypothetical protein
MMAWVAVGLVIKTNTKMRRTGRVQTGVKIRKTDNADGTAGEKEQTADQYGSDDDIHNTIFPGLDPCRILSYYVFS